MATVHSDDEHEGSASPVESPHALDPIDPTAVTAAAAVAEELVPAVEEEPEVDPDPTRAAALKAEGNELFKVLDYEGALSKYMEAFRLTPKTDVQQRAVCRGNRAACYVQQGEYKSAVLECTAALDLTPDYTKVRYRRAMAHERLDELDAAQADIDLVLKDEPKHEGANAAAARLKKAIEERNERLKKEMLGKLSELGNTLLGKFGLSLDNFKMQQDPNTGSYSINFQK